MPTNLNIPTQKSVGHNSHAPAIDAFNQRMRATDWYQNWFRQQGLNPNQVKLSKGQRKELEQLVLQRGGVPADAFNDMQIDPSGNLNTEHGFRSQPSWLKALEIGAVATGAAFAAPGSIGSLVGMGGSAPIAPVVAPAATGTTTAGALVGSSLPTLTSMTGAPIVAAGAVPTIASTAYGTGAALAPTIAGAALPAGHLALSAAPRIAQTVVPPAAKAGFSIADAFKTSFAPALNAVTNLAATRAQTSSNDRAAQIQADAIRHAADLQAKAAEEALAFTKGEYMAREGRLAPYRRVGEEAITRVGDLVRPGSGAAYLPPPTQYLPASALVRR